MYKFAIISFKTNMIVANRGVALTSTEMKGMLPVSTAAYFQSRKKTHKRGNIFTLIDT